MDGIVYLEDGSIYKGKGFGKKGVSVGEIVFNTSATGYQEILTDPTNAGTIITMTYPVIGGIGVNSIENESSNIYAKGFIVKGLSTISSNYLMEKDLEDFLIEKGVVGVAGVDTRSITRKIRSKGTMKCVIANIDISTDELKKIIEEEKEKEENFVKEVSTKKYVHIPGTGTKVAVVDFGVKNSIIKSLKDRDCDITIVPYNTSYKELRNLNPDGVLLSNGPGNPKLVPEGIELTKHLLGKLPIFGIGLGHQILALALGADIYKMKCGHRGLNHGIYDFERDKAYITSQNHSYAVKDQDLDKLGIIVTHKNLNDGSVEGLKHKYYPVFSVQFSPEGAPGPTDMEYIFDKFIDICVGKEVKYGA
ncbi:MAG: glutamine-hydrolyzing carbamoyl-phosphate synthase small subunit [Clostridiales bacterium]|uniref:glutamine-hydrolyzing carbamoyl-phosphate synthase small subunit n=1 Tax=Clostridium sp. N3C TaxID=1776758 RepID=UPI00092DF379|nr:glutamine-hydrolyzing carbamoyl-phosphate synthase small subunit [Clostridium sp. N3C]NLZ49222.1 glutamine-hydrolyzing carbamoyl-phosphate synthase small subunit [Clostridiales bacterium]SCN22397.1 Carbamoyl-phosphate synthase small chain [Clostridium sp. N3C]